MKSKSTYSLLVSSEEKGRAVFEGLICGLVVLCTVFSGWQFASTSFALPGMSMANNTPVALVAKVSPAHPVIGNRS